MRVKRLVRNRWFLLSKSQTLWATGSFWRCLSVLPIMALLLASSLAPESLKAATGINTQINFQARLQNTQGATVPDGTYNIEFKIYQDGNGCVSSGTSPCGGTLKWTEDWVYGSGSPDNRVTVKNGYFSVLLGSVNSTLGTAVDFNQDNLWLSLNIGNTSTAATFAGASGDGEMLPFKRFAANPYAINSGKLGGLSSSQFIQLAQGLQVDSSTTNASVAINKTGTTANILQLQRGGADVLVIANDGSTVFKNQTDSATAFRIQSATAAQTLFTADTTNNKIKIGDSTGTDTATTVLQVDATSTDPTTGLASRNGGLFYNSTLDQLKVIEAGAVARVCTTTAVCSGYAPASGNGYVQLAPSSVQVDSSANNSIFVNKTGASGNIFELQKAGVDKLVVDNSGNVGIGTSGAPSQLLSVGGTNGNFTVTTGGDVTTSGSLNTSGYLYGAASIGSNGLSGLASQANNFNVAPNSSFEVKTNPAAGVNADGWFTNTTVGNGTATITRASDAQATGIYSLKSVTTGTTSFTQMQSSTYIPVKPSTAYYSAIDVKNDATANNCSVGLIVRINWYTAAGAAASTAFNDVYSYGGTTTSWATYGGTATAPADALYALLEFYNFFNTGSCTRWFDNAIFRQISFNGDLSVIGNVGIGTTNPTQILTLGEGADRTINVETRASNASGRNLAIVAGTAGSGASAVAGGTLSLQGGAAAGSGTGANGGNVALQGGAGVGTGVQGLVALSTTAFSSASNQSFAANGSVTQSNIDNFSTVSVSSTVVGPITITVPNPTNNVIGRILYVTITGSNSVILSTPGGTPSFTMSPNSSATFVWNGSVWTNAGVDGGSNSYIQNQNSIDQAANFRISGTGRANTSFTTPLVDAIGSGTLGVGTQTTGNLTLGNNAAGGSNSTTLQAATGGITLRTAASQGSGNTGAITIQTGNAASGNGNTSGSITIVTGDGSNGSNGSSGSVSIDVGSKSGGSGTAGSITIGTGTNAPAAITISKTGGTLTNINGGLTLGASAGSGTLLTNNGATLFSTLAVTDRNGTNGTWLSGTSSNATTTVDIYTSFTVNQTTSSQTLQIPGPTSTTAGRIIYVSNIGSQSLTLLSATLNAGATATLVWNGSAWTYAGADGSSIINQNSADQTANFRISGSGQANTSFLTPLLDAATASSTLAIGTTNANQINLNQNTTIAAAKTLTVTSALTSLTGATTGDALNVSNSTSTGNIAVFKSNATAVATLSSKGNLTISPVATTTGSPTIFTVTAPAHTGLTNAEAIDANLNLARTVTFTGGASTSFATQRALVVQAPTYAATTGTLTITDVATQAITGAPVKGSNVALTNTHGLLIQSGAVGAATNSYGLTVNAQTGAANNYAAAFLGGNVGIGTTAPVANLDTRGTAQFRTVTDSTTSFMVQNSLGASSLTVDTTNTASSLNIAVNSGGETGGTPPTSWSSLTGTTTPTITQDTTTGEYASGAAGIKVAFASAGTGGVKNTVGTAAAVSTTYSTSFSIKSSSGTPALSVVFSPDGSATVACTAGSFASSSITTSFVKYTCKFTSLSSPAITSSAYLGISQTDSTARSLFIDNLSIVPQNSTGTQNTGVVKVGGGTSQGLTLFQLDTAAGTPFTGGNQTLAGAMYFDTTAGKMQCYDGSVWGACGAAPNSNITLTPEYAGAVLHGKNDEYGVGTDKNIGTLTSDFCGNGGGLSVNTSFCASGEARNFYSWTTTQPSYQSYGLFVTYKLPSTFKAFVGNAQLYGRVDNTTNAGVNYAIFRSTGSGITACGGGIVNVVGWSGSSANGSANAWTPATINPATSCSFAANDYVIFKIDVVGKSSANAYVENLNFSFSNQ